MRPLRPGFITLFVAVAMITGLLVAGPSYGILAGVCAAFAVVLVTLLLRNHG